MRRVERIVARDQGRIYFTYSGGRPFRTDAGPRPAGSTATAVAPVSLPPGTRRAEAVRGNLADPDTADAFARRGAARLSLHQFDGAIADLSEAIRRAPANAGYLRDRSRAYRNSGKAGLALADLDKALELAPRDAALLRMRAYARLAERDRVGALADAEAAAAVTPPASLEMAEVAFLFKRLNHPARAIALYDAIIALHRQDSQLGGLLNGRCWVRALANVELDRALDDCDRAIKRDGAKASYLDSRALVHFRRRTYAAAVADYDAALKLDPRHAWSLYLGGLTKRALGQAEAGDADKAAAVAVEPTIASEVASYGIP